MQLRTQVVECLGLSYHNSRKLYQAVDAIPPRTEWKTRSLWFQSHPEAKHYIHYRNPLEAIHQKKSVMQYITIYQYRWL